MFAKAIALALKAVGKKAIWYPTDGLPTSVKIEDMKIAYGQIRYLIKSEVGNAQKWVNADNVHVQDAVTTLLQSIWHHVF